MALRKKIHNPLSAKINLVAKPVFRSLYLKTFLVYVPNSLNLIMLENSNIKWILMYNSNYQFVLPIISKYSLVYLSYNKDVLKIDSKLNNAFYPTFLSHYNNILHTFYKPTFKKIKFRGKGYYIYKNIRNTIAPQFGYSHRIYIYSYFNHVKFIGKTKIIIFGLIKNDLIQASLNLKSKRPINIFTGRGVRFARQIVYKKQGKVSSYR